MATRAEYDIWLLSPTGYLLTAFNTFNMLDIQRTTSKQGQLELIIPDGVINMSYLGDDYIWMVWRSVDGGTPYLEGDTVFFTHYIDKILNKQGEKAWDIIAPDAMELAAHRVIPYGSDSTQANKTNVACDDMLKTFVSENMSSGATDALRNLSAAGYLTIQANQTLCPLGSKQAPHKTLLPTLQEVASDSFSLGRYLAFDFVYTGINNGQISLEFRTFADVRGNDHRWQTGNSQPIIFDPWRGNVADLSRILDNRDMDNAIYAGGKGTGANQIVATSIDKIGIGESPWNRHEEWIDARNADTQATVKAEADYELRNRRARKTFTDQFVDTPGLRYGATGGLHYGDFVTINWDADQIDMRADSLHLHVEGKAETVDIGMRSDVYGTQL